MLAAAMMTFPLLAAGCKGVGALGTPPRPLPDVAVLADAIAAEKVMIDRYRSAIAASPGRSAALGPLLAEHEAHLARLRSRLVDTRAAAVTPAAAPSRPGSASVSGSAVPASGSAGGHGTPATAIAVLEAAEDRAAAALIAHLTEVTPSLAQLLVSIAASEATHALVLRSRGGAA
jgi:hypothetical protein